MELFFFPVCFGVLMFSFFCLLVGTVVPFLSPGLLHIYTYRCIYIHIYIYIYKFMHIYIYIYINIYIYMYIYTYAHTYMYMSVYLYIYISIYLYIYIYLYVYISVCLYIYISIYPYICVSIYLYIHTSMYVHIGTRISTYRFFFNLLKHTTSWRRCTRCLIVAKESLVLMFIGHFPQKSPIISGLSCRFLVAKDKSH